MIEFLRDYLGSLIVTGIACSIIGVFFVKFLRHTFHTLIPYYNGLQKKLDDHRARQKEKEANPDAVSEPIGDEYLDRVHEACEASMRASSGINTLAIIESERPRSFTKLLPSLRYYSAACITIGLLATFLGLTISLSNIPSIIDEATRQPPTLTPATTVELSPTLSPEDTLSTTPSQSPSEATPPLITSTPDAIPSPDPAIVALTKLKEPLGAMGIAFVTSLVGLFASLLINLFDANFLKPSIQGFEASFESYLDNELSRRYPQNVTAAVNKMAEQIGEFKVEVQTLPLSIERTAKVLQEVLGPLQSTIESFGKHIGTFRTTVQDLHKENVVLTEKVQTIQNTSENLANSIGEQMQRSVENALAMLNSGAEKIGDAIIQLDKNVQVSTDANVTFTKTMNEIKDMNSKLVDRTSELKLAYERTNELLRSTSIQIGETLREFSDSVSPRIASGIKDGVTTVVNDNKAASSTLLIKMQETLENLTIASEKQQATWTDSVKALDDIRRGILNSQEPFVQSLQSFEGVAESLAKAIETFDKARWTGLNDHT
jgi:hypothetical protein